jgi:hypothetical protein
MAAAPDAYNKENNEEKAKTEEAIKTSILEGINNRKLEPVEENTNQSTYTPAKEPPKTPWYKSLATKIGIAAVTVLPLKEATAQQKMNNDKEGIKKEASVHIPAESHVVDEKLKKDWHNYVVYVKEAKLDQDPRMNTKVFADKVLSEYIQNHPGTSLSPEKVIDIQNEFINYRQWALDKIQHTVKGKGKQYEFADGVSVENFMQNLSKADQIAGAQTIRDFPSEFETFTHEMILKGKINGQDVEYPISVEKPHTEYKGFSSMSDD